MLRNRAVSICVLVLTIAAVPQVALSQAGRVMGELTTKSGNQLTIRDDSGKSTSVSIGPATSYQRIAPGETSLAKAEKITFDSVTEGDRLLARLAADGTASSIIVISKIDVQQKRQAEQADWQKRGLYGTVTAIDATSKNLAVTLRGKTETVTVVPATSTRFMRYPPGSVRWDETKPGKFEEISAGDQVRILGNREGDKVAAEMVVSGSFRSFAGTVQSIDAANGTFQINDLATKKVAVVRTSPSSKLKRLPPMLAQMLAQPLGNAGEAGPGARARTDDAARGPGAAGGPAGGRELPPEMAEAAKNGNIQPILERLPALQVSELKAGDAVIVSSSAAPGSSELIAIAVIAGVEPMFTTPAAGQDARLSGPMNLDIIMP